jgi:hypothetical protein
MLPFPTACRLALFALVLAAVAAPGAHAQPEARSMYNQDRLAELFYARRDSLDDIPEVRYRAHVVSDPSGLDIVARAALYQSVGDGDVALGKQRLTIPAFLNGVYMDAAGNLPDIGVGDTLVLPDHYDLDFRAYAPFPRHWAGGATFDKLFVIHKGVQAWAAYENGRLARWGLVSTGKDESETPNGRYNFNWRELHRVSTLSPPGQSWDMRWVFNFYDERGIHVHQYYALPTDGAASHGCVRLMTADAQWIYDWADGWVTVNGTADAGLASRGRILRQGTTVLVLGEQPDGAPRRFAHTPEGPQLVRVELPADPYSVRAGSPQQVQFDRARAAAARAAAPARATPTSATPARRPAPARTTRRRS